MKTKGSIHNRWTPRPDKQYYAYTPGPNGEEPVTTNTGPPNKSHGMIYTRRESTARIRARQRFGPGVVLYECLVFHDRTTWQLVMGEPKQSRR